MVEQEPELEHGEQQEREDRHQEGELDESLAPLTVVPPPQARDHRIGSMRMEFDWVSVKPDPP